MRAKAARLETCPIHPFKTSWRRPWQRKRCEASQTEREPCPGCPVGCFSLKHHVLHAQEVTNGRAAQQDLLERSPVPPSAKRRRCSSHLAAGEGALRWQVDGQREQRESRQPGSGGELQQPQQECTGAPPGGGHGSHARDPGLPEEPGEPAAAQGVPSLLELNELLLMKVLAQLSPEDLLVAAQACRQLNAAASDAALWRRLYLSRCAARDAPTTP